MDMNIGSRLDEAMREAKIQSQSQLARSSGVPQPTINRILKGQGKQGPETSTLIALARALSVEVCWLQTGEGVRRSRDARHQDDGGARGEVVRLINPEPPAALLLQWVTQREAEFLSELRERSEAQQGRLMNALRRLPKLAADIPDRDKA